MGAPLEYYNDLDDSYGVVPATTIVLQDGDSSADYRLVPPFAAVASNGNGTNVRVINVSRKN